MERSGDPTGAGARPDNEYRVAHLQERLARGEAAELGMRIDVRGDTLVISGTVPTAEHREKILRLVTEELPDVRVRADITVADVSAPERPEDMA